MKIISIVGIGIGLFLLTLLVLSFFNDSQVSNQEISDMNNSGEKIIGGEWKSINLKNIQNGQNYTIQNLSDKPILLESFAIWCPSCTRQQKEIQKLKEIEFSEKFYAISLNTDQNEDESKVLEHIQNNKFTGIYSISSKEFTNSLINDFGLSIVNAPSVPIILICPGLQKTHYLESGIKTYSELKENIESLCQIMLDNI